MRLDDRTIHRIGWASQEAIPLDYCSINVGRDGVTKIDATDQNLGEYGICWLQVWKGDTLVSRFNARNIDSIIYDEV